MAFKLVFEVYGWFFLLKPDVFKILIRFYFKEDGNEI
jgi:hypothetical protein